MFWPVQSSKHHRSQRVLSRRCGLGHRAFECSKVTFDNVYVDSTSSGNRDGIDVVDSSDVTSCTRCCTRTTNSICPKSGVAKGVKNLVVHDTPSPSPAAPAGIKLGTTSYGALEDSTFTDVLIKNVDKGGISIESADGADVRKPDFPADRDRPLGRALLLLIENRGRMPGGSPRKIGSIDGVHFIDVRATGTISSIGSPMMAPCRTAPLPIEEHHVREMWRSSSRGRHDRARGPGRTTAGYPEFNMFGTLPASAYYFRHVDG